MSGFSEDCNWWWDGQAWVATSQVVIPDLPASDRATELEARARPHRLLDKANVAAYFVPFDGWSLNSTLVWPWLFTYRRGFRAYRELMLERLKSATTYLLGPDEPAIAAEVGMYSEIVVGQLWGGNAVVVTGRHVLIIASDRAVGQPRRVLIVVNAGGQFWSIKGMNGIIQPKPVIAAWSSAAAAVKA